MDSAREIENLLYAYAERIDLGDFDGVAELFTHASIYSHENAPPEGTFVGADGARKMYEMSTKRYPDTGTPKTKHIISNAQVYVDQAAGTGSARSYFCVLQATEALALQPIIAGRYLDTFQLIEGVWWFASRTFQIDLTGDLSQHLNW